jgi:hypothetical protein
MPGSCSKTYATSFDGACNICNIKVEEDVFIIEESLITIKEEVYIAIKQEEISDIKAESGEVSYVYICLLLDTF